MQTDEYFIIDSENLEEINTKLYGYILLENHIQTQVIPENELTGNGMYIQITKNNNQINIIQDTNGSYGLYIYQEKEDKFTISNSLTKLIEYLKEKQPLTLNDEYSKAFLTSKQNLSFDETIIKEITHIPKDYKISINKNNKKLTYQNTEIQEKTIELSSTEAIGCIDNWFNHWIKIIRNISQQENSIIVNMDETLSSRVILSLILNSNIDSKNIQLINNNPDSKIMTQLSEASNLTINKPQQENIENIQESIEKSYNIKLSINSEIKLQNNRKCVEFNINNTNPYPIHENKTLEEIIDAIAKKSEFYSKNVGKIIEQFSWRNIHKLQKYLKEYDIYSQDFHESLYKHIFLRNNLKDDVEEYLSNRITLNPLLDVDLQKIKITDKQELYTTILHRYNKELLEIEFSDENIRTETISNAININEKFPLKKQDYSYLDYFPKSNENRVNTRKSVQEYNDLIRKIFFSNTFKHTFLKYYSDYTYNQIIKKYTEYDSHDICELNPSIAIIKIMDDIEYSQKNMILTEYEWLKSFIIKETPKLDSTFANSLLNKYNTSRIDIKNEGMLSNQIKLLEISDETSNITKPSWFTNEKGEGICISNYNSSLSLKIKCINDGILKIYLRSLDIRDRNNKRFPIFIDYLNFKVDNQEVLEKNTLAWHDDPITFSKQVCDEEIITIDIKWKPFSNLSSYDKKE